jgi:hypothetical protein
MTILLRFWREILIVLLGLGVYLQHKYKPVCEAPKTEVVVQEKVVFKDKIVYVDRVVTRDRIITKPDGTKIEERTKTEEKKRKEEKKHKEEKSTEIKIPVNPPKSTHINIALDPLAKFRDNEYVGLLGGGLRLGNTPLFLTINPTINLSNPRIENLFIGLTLELQ